MFLFGEERRVQRVELGKVQSTPVGPQNSPPTCDQTDTVHEVDPDDPFPVPTGGVPSKGRPAGGTTAVSSSDGPTLDGMRTMYQGEQNRQKVWVYVRLDRCHSLS